MSRMHPPVACKLGNHPGKVLGHCTGMLTCGNGGDGNPEWDSQLRSIDAHMHCTSGAQGKAQGSTGCTTLTSGWAVGVQVGR
jgi:hypothetical protein